MLRKATVAFACLGGADAQQAGTNKKEEHIPMALTECTKAGGCVKKGLAVTMDAQWRWLHDAHKNKYANCIQGQAPWDASIVGHNAAKGATNCALEGISTDDYKGTYGVEAIKNGISLQYVTGTAVGSRLYMMETADKYKKFNLMNREFTMDVDVSELECGLNGAVYFVEMEANGGKGKGENTAGAQYGTGYCDAQCPHDLKFIDGEANLKDWHMTPVGPVGRYGSCCTEVDIWEANRYSTAYTVHACKTHGPLECKDNVTCGWTDDSCKCCDDPDNCDCCNRYKGVCDKDGCDYNHYRLGDKKFFCKGDDCTVNSAKPITVVTQFITTDGTDDGDLKEMRRIYVQDGKIIKNSKAFEKYDSINDDMCHKQKEVFDNPDDYTPKGNIAAVGDSLKRGHVLTLSLWDDDLTHMLWLDSAAPPNDPEHPFTEPGVVRGPCAVDTGKPADLRGPFSTVKVKYFNVMVGEIGTTFGTESSDAARNSPSPLTPASILSADAPPELPNLQPDETQQNSPSNWGNKDEPTNDDWSPDLGEEIQKPQGHPHGEPEVEPKTDLKTSHKCCTGPKIQGTLDGGCFEHGWATGFCEESATNCKVCVPNCDNCWAGPTLETAYEDRGKVEVARVPGSVVMSIGGFSLISFFVVGLAVVASKRMRSSRNAYSQELEAKTDQQELLAASLEA